VCSFSHTTSLGTLFCSLWGNSNGHCNIFSSIFWYPEGEGVYKRQDEAGSKAIRYYIFFFSVSTQKLLKQFFVGNKVLILSWRRLFRLCCSGDWNRAVLVGWWRHFGETCCFNLLDWSVGSNITLTFQSAQFHQAFFRLLGSWWWIQVTLHITQARLSVGMNVDLRAHVIPLWNRLHICPFRFFLLSTSFLFLLNSGLLILK